jgi:predicted amidohydrolase YtcJ
MIRLNLCRNWLAASIFALVALAQSKGNATARVSSASRENIQQKDSQAFGFATLVLSNGNIYTGDLAHPRAKNIAINDGMIAAVADSDSVPKSWIGPHSRVIDLQGQFAMPGFNDAHVHLAAAGFAKLEVNLEGARSLAEFQQRIRDRLSDYKPDEWITGSGWDHTLWPDKKFPTRQDLDAVSTSHPMFFSRTDGHVAVANSRALEIAGITKSTPDPTGGRIQRDPGTGEPTGMLEEDAAMNHVFARIPPPSAERLLRALNLAIAEATQFGVTSVQDNSVEHLPEGSGHGWDIFRDCEQMKREGKLTLRVTEWLPFDAILPALEKMRTAGGGSSAENPGDPWLKTGALKAFMDGSLGSRTAAMLAPYTDDPGNSGILRVDPAQLEKMSIERDRAGFQLAFHAIGDRANRVALDTFAAVVTANGPRDRRDRIEHAQIIAPVDLGRLAALGVIASMQPSHLLDDQRWAAARIASQRLLGAYAWHSLLADGTHLAFGTDYPVEPINPLRGIYSCITRELPDGGPQGGWEPQEKLTMDECLSAYTSGAAFAQFEEKRKGKLMPGMFADVVVFPVEITHIPSRDLLTTRPSMTIVGGLVVYGSPILK